MSSFGMTITSRPVSLSIIGVDLRCPIRSLDTNGQRKFVRRPCSALHNMSFDYHPPPKKKQKKKTTQKIRLSYPQKRRLDSCCKNLLCKKRKRRAGIRLFTWCWLGHIFHAKVSLLVAVRLCAYFYFLFFIFFFLGGGEERETDNALVQSYLKVIL